MKVSTNTDGSLSAFGQGPIRPIVVEASTYSEVFKAYHEQILSQWSDLRSAPRGLS
jgi:hypothetical protein